MAETVSYSSALGLTSGSFARKSCHFLFHQKRRIPLECSYSLLPVRQHFSDGPHLPLPPGWGGRLHLSKCTCFMLWKIIGWTMELPWIYMCESSHNPSCVCGIGPWIWEMTDKYFSKHLWFQNSECCWNVSTSENGNFTRKWKNEQLLMVRAAMSVFSWNFWNSYSVLLCLWFPHTLGTTSNIC